MGFAICYIVIGVAWIALLFYPRFTIMQLLKTVIAGCCSFCPLLLIGMSLCQGKVVFVSNVWLDILVVAYFLFTPLFCLIAFIWNTVDIVRYSRKKAESKEYLRACGQLMILAIFVVYLVAVCGPMIWGIGC